MVRFLTAILFVLLSCMVYSEELPEDDLQVNFNTYFDNFGVTIIYPDVSVNKSITNSTSINARYLVDIITAASMRSHFDSVYSFVNAEQGIDAYTSATKKTSGGSDSNPDELRHEIGVGITQLFGDVTVSLNNLYSTEHDYTSETVAASVNVPFANKNTIFNFGVVKSWDVVAPQIRTWEKKKDVLSLSLGVTQVYSVDFLAQLNLSFSSLSGFLSDPYQHVTVRNFDENYYAFYEPVLPDTRKRYAAGLRGKYRLSDVSSLELDYRYYNDDWDIRSHTINGLYQRLFNEENIIFGAGLRTYFQSASKYFGTAFDKVEEYMAVDSKLNAMYSVELQLKLKVNGSLIPFIDNEDIDLNSRLNFFVRNTDTPDWHSGYNTLYSYIFSLGFRYLLD